MIGMGNRGDIFGGPSPGKGLTGKGLDCAQLLVLNNEASISWASSIMSEYMEILEPCHLK